MITLPPAQNEVWRTLSVVMLSCPEPACPAGRHSELKPKQMVKMMLKTVIRVFIINDLDVQGPNRFFQPIRLKIVVNIRYYY